MEQIDVAIVGGGPAGLRAALVLARTRKRTVVFDSPEPPRNAVSHGVHNFVGLDGLTPAEIRRRAWEQIDRYDSARLVTRSVTSIERPDPDGDFIVHAGESVFSAAHAVLSRRCCGRHPISRSRSSKHSPAGWDSRSTTTAT